MYLVHQKLILFIKLQFFNQGNPGGSATGHSKLEPATEAINGNGIVVASSDETKATLSTTTTKTTSSTTTSGNNIQTGSGLTRLDEEVTVQVIELFCSLK